MLILDVLKSAITKNASDVILSSGNFPCFKINGKTVYQEEIGAITTEALKGSLYGIMSNEQKKDFDANKELDFALEIPESRFRVNVFLHRNGISGVFRPIKTEIPKFEDLNLPQQILGFGNKKHGLVLITGGVGTGKSTTLASIIDYINANEAKHIITIEDPIEYTFTSKKSVLEQREVGEDTLSFENGLKYALRQSSDVIMVGEMRDLSTFRLALRAAETGNLVFATLHTSGAARTVARVIDMFPGEERDQIRQQLSESLVAVVWQDLIERRDKTGRIPAVEILINTTPVANMIRKGVTHQLDGAIETSAREGMVTMKKTLENFTEKGIITKDDLVKYIKYYNLENYADQ